MHKNRWFALWITVCVPIAVMFLFLGTDVDAQPTGQFSSYIILDETFELADWSATVLDTRGFGETFTATQRLTGGNPGAYRHFTHTLPAENIAPNQATARLQVAHVYEKESFDPSMFAEVGSATVSMDGRTVSRNVVYAEPIIVQDDMIFRRGTAVFGFFDDTWRRVSLTASPELYTALDGSGQNPDLSSSGTPIKFGIIVIDNHFFPTAGIYTHTFSVDNFRFEIFLPGTVPSPTPTTPASQPELMLTPESPDVRNINIGSPSLFSLGTPFDGITVTNSGIGTAEEVVADITLFLPDDTFQTSTTYSSNCSLDTQQCQLGDIASGTSMTFTAVHRFEHLSQQGRSYIGPASYTARISSSSPNVQPVEYHESYQLYNCSAILCPFAEVFCEATFFRSSNAVASESPLTDRLRGITAVAFNLPLYYQVRDDIMRQTINGRRLIALFEEHQAELLMLVSTNQALFDDALAAFQLWDPAIENLVNGDGTITLSQAQVDALDGFLTSLSAAGSLSLQEAITTERQSLGEIDQYAGQPIGTVSKEIVSQPIETPETIYLPIVTGPIGFLGR